MYYRVNLYPQEEPGTWQAYAEFRHDQNGLGEWLDDNAVYGRLPHSAVQELYDNGIAVEVGTDTLNDDFGGKIAKVVRSLIEEITPVVNDFEGADNDEEV